MNARQDHEEVAKLIDGYCKANEWSAVGVSTSDYNHLVMVGSWSAIQTIVSKY